MANDWKHWVCNCETINSIASPRCQNCGKICADGHILKEHDTKIDSMWKISKEHQKNFIEKYLKDVDEIEVHDLFKMIRGAEYRRGKQDGLKEKENDNMKNKPEGIRGGDVMIHVKHKETGETGWLLGSDFVDSIVKAIYGEKNEQT